MAERSFMSTGFWGKKVGMTQVFLDNKVVPATMVNAANWIVTNIRTKERDGYNALQVGCVKERYMDQTFSPEWLKNMKCYFSLIREVEWSGDVSEVTIGKPVDFFTVLQGGDKVDVSGTSKGRGFAGVVKRYGFGGPPGSHGATMGKRPGSIGHMRSQGRVIKGKKLPGHMGVDWKTVQKLEVIRVEPDAGVVLIKGSAPGNAGSFLYVRKA